jgi:hypothetical protein
VIEESAHSGIIIQGLEVIQVTLSVVDVAMMAKMVGSKRFDDCEYDVAKRIKSVFSDRLSIAIDNGYDIVFGGCSAVVPRPVML